ncbi:MAG: hypothetical protein JWO44_2338 [Bacteroidetes bacterium]|nr:hypothetical protein [Bacteroidota bacterium]
MTGKKPTTSKIYSVFFDSGNQQKKWFVVFSVLLPLLLTIIFSAWGTIISVKSYDLSVETSNNREQLDTMEVMIGQLKEQNRLLIDQNTIINAQMNQLAKIISLNENSNEVQTKHLSTVLGSLNDSKIPRLAIDKVEYELGSGGQAEFAEFYYLKIVNYGGSIYDLKSTAADSMGLDPGYLPVNGSVPGNSNVTMIFKNPFLYTDKDKLRLRFIFRDARHVKYYEDLTLTETAESVDFQLGKMIPVTK